jgi:hypothetical protein
VQLRRAEDDQKEAIAAADRMQKELAAAAATRRAIDASFQRLDKARERTHAALSMSRPESRNGGATPSPASASSAAAALQGHTVALESSRSARSALATPAASHRASSLGPLGARGLSEAPDRPSTVAGGIGDILRVPSSTVSDVGALSRELSKRESGWRERVAGRVDSVRWKSNLQGAQSGGEQGESGFRQSPSFRQSPTLGALSGRETTFSAQVATSLQQQ